MHYWQTMVLMLRLMLFFCILACSVESKAQFNDSTFHHLKYSSMGILNKTDDTRSFTLTNALNFSIRKKIVTLNNSNAWIYGRQGDRLTNNDFSSAVNFDVLKDVRKLYYWGLASFVTSYSLKINHQFQVGGGIGYNFINMEKAELVVSDGLLYETADLEVNGTRDKFQTVRNSLRVKYHFETGSISLDGTHFWQPSLEDISDYIIRSNNTLSVKLRKWLSVTASLIYNKLSRTNRENLLVNFGLVAETYF